MIYSTPYLESYNYGLENISLAVTLKQKGDKRKPLTPFENRCSSPKSKSVKTICPLPF